MSLTDRATGIYDDTPSPAHPCQYCGTCYTADGNNGLYGRDGICNPCRYVQEGLKPQPIESSHPTPGAIRHTPGIGVEVYTESGWIRCNVNNLNWTDTTDTTNTGVQISKPRQKKEPKPAPKPTRSIRFEME